MSPTVRPERPKDPHRDSPKGQDRLLIAAFAVLGGPLATAFGSLLLVPIVLVLPQQVFLPQQGLLSLLLRGYALPGPEPFWHRWLSFWGILLAPVSLAASIFAGVWATRFLERRKQSPPRARFYFDGARWGLLYGLGCLGCVFLSPPVIVLTVGDPLFALVCGLSGAASGALFGWAGAMMLGRRLNYPSSP